MIIIGFGHKARNGKDSAAQAILDYYAQQNGLLSLHGVAGGLNVVRIGFADALYQEARTLHGMKEKDAVLLQNVGMARRKEDSEYWIKKAFASIPKGTSLALFTDVRFLNEAAAIKKAGGHLVEVVRLNPDGSRYYADDRPKDHPSETELDGYNWDHYIKTKSAAETGELAVTLAEYIRGLETR